MRKTVKITIEGEAKTGKTTLAAILYRVLGQRYGLGVGLMDDDDHDAPSAISLSVDPTILERRVRALDSSGVYVEIETRQARRGT